MIAWRTDDGAEGEKAEAIENRESYHCELWYFGLVCCYLGYDVRVDAGGAERVRVRDVPTPGGMLRCEYFRVASGHRRVPVRRGAFWDGPHGRARRAAFCTGSHHKTPRRVPGHPPHRDGGVAFWGGLGVLGWPGAFWDAQGVLGRAWPVLGRPVRAGTAWGGLGRRIRSATRWRGLGRLARPGTARAFWNGQRVLERPGAFWNGPGRSGTAQGAPVTPWGVVAALGLLRPSEARFADRKRGALDQLIEVEADRSMDFAELQSARQAKRGASTWW